MMDYERTMTELFTGDSDLFSGKRIILGIGDLETMLYQKTQHMLGIYQVFIASKGNKQNFHIIQLLAPLLFPLPLQLQIPEGL